MPPEFPGAFEYTNFSKIKRFGIFLRGLIVQSLEKELFGIFIRVVVPGQKRRAFGMAIKEAAPYETASRKCYVTGLT